jgi:hypothetical protein
MRRSEWLFVIILFIFVIASRALTSGPVYFADGPRHIASIANHTYVIQPPGYWLFNRFGSLFPDPERAFLVFNWLVSAIGSVIFYLLARKFVSETSAKLGAVLYSVVFFIWFSGNVHSTYASQLLFPVLAVYLMVRYAEGKASWIPIALGLCFAAGAGLRPSDGVFIGPMLIYFAIREMSVRDSIKCFSVAFAGCLLWVIPTFIALHANHRVTFSTQVSTNALGAIPLGHFNLYTLANFLRYFLPLVVAIGIIAPFAFLARSKWLGLLWLWVSVGSIFFVVVYISDAPYLDFMMGGILLLSLLGMERKLPRIAVNSMICVAITINLCVYWLFRPLPESGRMRLSDAILNKDIGMYTHYGVQHQVMIKLRETAGKAL